MTCDSSGQGRFPFDSNGQEPPSKGKREKRYDQYFRAESHPITGAPDFGHVKYGIARTGSRRARCERRTDNCRKLFLVLKMLCVDKEDAVGAERSIGVTFRRLGCHLAGEWVNLLEFLASVEAGAWSTLGPLPRLLYWDLRSQVPTAERPTYNSQTGLWDHPPLGSLLEMPMMASWNDSDDKPPPRQFPRWMSAREPNGCRWIHVDGGWRMYAVLGKAA